MSLLLHLRCLHIPRASIVAGTQFRISCKLFILYCSIKHRFIWPGLICCAGRALERKTNTQPLNRKVTVRETVRVRWALLLQNICAGLQCCADNRKEMTLQDDGTEYTRYFCISQTQGVVSQPLINLQGFPLLTMISKLKIGQKKMPLLKLNLFCRLRENRRNQIILPSLWITNNRRAGLRKSLFAKCSPLSPLRCFLQVSSCSELSRNHWFSWTG